MAAGPNLLPTSDSAPAPEPVLEAPGALAAIDDFSFDTELSPSPEAPGETPAPVAPSPGTGGEPAGGPPSAAAPLPAPPEAPGALTPGAAAPPSQTPAVPAAPTAAAPTVVQSPSPTSAAPPAPQAPGVPGDLMQMRESLVADIASRYTVSEEVRNQLLLEPDKVLPTMAARIMVDTYDAVMQTVMAQIPQMQAQREHVVQVSRQTEEKFFQRWPALKDPAYSQDILTTARAFRQANPQATPEQALEAVGAIVHVQRGIPLSAPTQAPPQVAPSVRPPIPVSPGGAVRSPAASTPAQGSIWDELSTIE